MTDQKIKASADKPPLGMIPDSALVGVARVFEYGAKKYAPGNFLQATLEDGAGARYVSALRRHMKEMQQPNGLWSAESLGRLDDESGLPHIDHAICSLIMLRAIMIKDGALSEDPRAWLMRKAEPEVPRPTGPGDAPPVAPGPRFIVKHRGECRGSDVVEIWQTRHEADRYARDYNEMFDSFEAEDPDDYPDWQWCVVDTHAAVKR